MADRSGIWTICDEPTENQDFTATPSEAATNTASAAGTNTGAREYSVSGLEAGTTYDVVLFDAANVTVDDDGVVTFADAEGANQAGNDQADRGTVTAEIEQVNGSGIIPASAIEVEAQADGTVTFLVDAEQADSIIPVLFLDAFDSNDSNTDADDNNALDLDANNEPVEAELFAVGGQKTWVPVEGADGTLSSADTVTSVDKGANSFVTGTGAGAFTYFYEAEDTFYVNNTQVSQAEFERQLSTVDSFLDANTVYNREGDAAGDTAPSSFNLNNVNPDPTSTVAANPVNATTAEIVIDDDDEQQDSFNVYRALGDQTNDNCGNVDFNADRAGFTLITTIAAENSDNTSGDDAEFRDSGLNAETTYCYVVTAVNDGDEGPGVEDGVTTTATGTTAAPTITNAEVTTDAVVTGAADDGDIWELDFSEAMNAPADGAVLDLVDVDGDTFRVVCDSAGAGTIAADPTQGEALCELAADDADGVMNDLTVTITTTPSDRNAVGDGVLEYPVTITDTNGFTDAGNGLEVDLENSSDVLVDDETP